VDIEYEIEIAKKRQSERGSKEWQYKKLLPKFHFRVTGQAAAACDQ
jgi:hypothetical protein